MGDAKLAVKELPGTKIAHCNQLHVTSTFDVLSAEHKSNILNGVRSFYEASLLRHLIKKFHLENSKVLHSDSCTS